MSKSGQLPTNQYKNAHRMHLYNVKLLYTVFKNLVRTNVIKV